MTISRDTFKSLLSQLAGVVSKSQVFAPSINNQGLNGRSSAVAAPSTPNWFEVLAITNGTSFATLLTDTAHAPTQAGVLPTGYTSFRHLGWAFYRPTSNDFVRFRQLNDRVVYLPFDFNGNLDRLMLFLFSGAGVSPQQPGNATPFLPPHAHQLFLTNAEAVLSSDYMISSWFHPADTVNSSFLGGCGGYVVPRNNGTYECFSDTSVTTDDSRQFLFQVSRLGNTTSTLEEVIIPDGYLDEDF